MEINIQAIADSKIKAMHESGEIQKRIEDDVEKLILKAVDDALDGYRIRSEVQDAVSSSVSTALKELDFTAYNGFISEKVKQLTTGILRATGILREDISQKIQKTFENIFLVKREKIKLSEILKAYREWICEATEESKKYELENFFVEMNDREPEYSWIDFTLSKEKQDRYSYRDDDYISFTVYRGYKEPKSIGSIDNVTFGSTDIGKTLKIGPYNDFEALLANLVYNKTPVEIDIEDEDDIDTSFDVDY